MAQYAGFARLYDMFMDDTDYDAWADYVEKLIGMFAAPKCTSVLECGCGTGEMTLRLKKRGFDITGSDISPDMLAEASEKTRRAGLKIPFVRMDMRSIALHRAADCITSHCDCVNYLTSPRACGEFFKSAYAALRPGGLLLFDISSRHKLRDVLGQNTFSDSRDDAAYIWKNNYDDESRLIEMELEFFVRAGTAPDGRPLYERFFERHVQRAHSEKEICTRLAEAGFETAGVFEAFTFDAPTEKSERLQFAAVKR